jgi:hypothetical protein
MVAESIASLNAAETLLVRGTAVAAGTGTVNVIVGAVTGGGSSQWPPPASPPPLHPANMAKMPISSVTTNHAFNVLFFFIAASFYNP